MEQLSLNLIEDQSSSYNVLMFKDDRRILALRASSYGGAEKLRETFVRLLLRSHRCSTAWEDAPRATGWLGIGSSSPQGASVYSLIIDKDPIGAPVNERRFD